MIAIANSNFTLASILAGFSFSIVVQLLSMKDKRDIVSWSIAAFTIAGALFIFGAYIEYRTLNTLVRLTPPYPQPIIDKIIELDKYRGIIGFGIVSFTIGIVLSGWIQSKIVGIISTIAGLGLLYFIFQIVDMLP